MKKGAKLYIEGALQTRKWQDQQGQERYTTEVVLQGFNGQLTMLDGRTGTGMGAGVQEGGQADYAGDYGSGGGGMSSDADQGSRRPAPASGGSKAPAKGGFDKKIDDEIPF